MDLTFPDVGEGLSEGVLAKWLVKVGDTISKDQPIARVSTDKSVVDIPSSIAGVVSELLFSEGSTINVGDVILRTGDGSAEPETKEPEAEAKPAQSSQADAPQPDTPEPKAKPVPEKAQAATPQPEAAAPEEEPEPEEHPDASHIDPTKRLAAQVPQRERIEKPSKTNVEASTKAPHASTNEVLALPSTRHYAREHHIDLSTITGSGPDGRVTLGDLTGHSQSEQASQVKREVEAPHVYRDVLATPAVRRYARELGIDITTVTGSGEHGRITREDLDTHSTTPSTKQPQSSPTQPVAKAPSVPKAATPQIAKQSDPQPTTAKPVAQETAAGSELSPIRKVIAKRMMSSHTNTAPVTHTDRADVTELVALRERYKEHAQAHEVKLTYLPFFIKATVAALKAYPRFNSSLEGETLTIHDAYHIGIAVDTEKGLFVPVIRDADRKSILELAREVSELARAARDGTLTPQQMQGATFTITSVGNLGGEAFTPIINEPNAAILGIGAIKKMPHVHEGALAVREIVIYSLTYDHRIVDGADGARFVAKIVELTEDPDHLLLEMS